MMPFSVLRMWGLGIFGWALLGLGIYLAVQTYDQFSHTAPAMRIDPAIDLDRHRTENEVPRAARAPVAEAAPDRSFDWEPWALLAGTLACFGVSFGGMWPVSYLLSGGRNESPAEVAPTKTFSVDRPDGSRLHGEIYGDDARPTLLLTHGWSLDITAWDYVKRDLSRHYRVVVWDLPGMGRSKGPTNNDFSLEKLAHDLEAVRRATAPNSPVILIGHSIGGMTLQTFCRLYPEQLGQAVQGLVLVHTTYTNPLHTNLASTATTLLETPLIVPLNYLTIALAPLMWLSNLQSYLNGSLHCMTRFASFTGRQSPRQLDHAARLAAFAWPAAVARGNLAMLQFNEERTLPEVTVPVLIIAGANDRMTLPSASERLETLLPNGRPVSVAGGHLGHWEFNEREIGYVCEFADHAFAARSAQAPAASTSRAE